MTEREAYRIMSATRRRGGGFNYSPMRGDRRIFATWREANEAVQAHRAAGRTAAMQAVLIDDDGAITWPPSDRKTSSKGYWSLAPMVRHARRVAMPSRKPSRNSLRKASGRTPRKPKCALDPRVAARIADIRTTNPGFGRGGSALPENGASP